LKAIRITELLFFFELKKGIFEKKRRGRGEERI